MGCGGCALGTSMNPGGNYVGARLADAEDGKTTIVFSGEVHLSRGERIIVETDGGPEFAEVTTASPALPKSCSAKKAKRFLRLASDSEYADYAERVELQARARRLAEERARARRLEINIVKCVTGFDRRKMVVHFTSDQKVDTRDVARELANELQMRVDMRLIGVRDETRLIGGIGSCGLTLCCSTWLKGFHPVTIRMAKLQGIQPNPAKLTGICGRLKCCIAYELEGGIEAARKMGSSSERGGAHKGGTPPAAA